MLKIYPLLIVFALFSCTRTPPEIQASIDRLTAQEQQVKQAIRSLQGTKSTLEQEVSSLSVLREEVRALEHQKNGGEVEYVLIFRLSQKRALSMPELKDMMNQTEFSVNVDRKTYNRYRVGDVYFEKLREGSAVTEGSISSWYITVKDKRVTML